MAHSMTRIGLATLILLGLAACASGAGGAGGREVFDTRDLVVEADVPSNGLWYVAEGTAADAVDDVSMSISPAFDGDVVREAAVGLAPLLVSGAVPADQQLSVAVTVSSFDAADNAEVRCSVYFEGNLLVEDVGVGASPVARCTGDVDLSDYRD